MMGSLYLVIEPSITHESDDHMVNFENILLKIAFILSKSDILIQLRFQYIYVLFEEHNSHTSYNEYFYLYFLFCTSYNHPRIKHMVRSGKCHPFSKGYFNTIYTSSKSTMQIRVGIDRNWWWGFVCFYIVSIVFCLPVKSAFFRLGILFWIRICHHGIVCMGKIFYSKVLQLHLDFTNFITISLIVWALVDRLHQIIDYNRKMLFLDYIAQWFILVYSKIGSYGLYSPFVHMDYIAL